MRRGAATRGIALVSVLLSSTLLLVLVAVLLDLGTVQLQRATADLRAVQSLAGADAGVGWVRGVLDGQQGDITATLAHLATVQGKRRLTIDSRTHVEISVSLIQAQPISSGGNHVDDNLEQNPRVSEVPLQIQSSATVFVNGVAVAHRSTTALLRVFAAPPYSAIEGEIDDGGPVGIDSPGDAGGQFSAPNTTELLVKAYTIDQGGSRHPADDYGSEQWYDNNSQGSGPLP